MFLLLLTSASAQEVRLRTIGLDQGLPQSYVNQITQDVEGFIWFGTQDGLARFDGREIRAYRHSALDSASLPGNNVSVLSVGKDSVLYAATGDGWCRKNPRNETWTRIQPNQYPGDLIGKQFEYVHRNGVNLTFTDRYGRVWVGSSSSGLVVKDPRNETEIRFSTKEVQDRRITNDDIWAICEDGEGRIWVGTNGGGVNIITNNKVERILRHTPLDETSLSCDVVRTIFKDNIGTMWIGTYGGGISHYDPYAHSVSRLRPSRFAIGQKDDFVRAIAEGDNGRLFIGTRHGVLVSDTSLRSCSVLIYWRELESTIGEVRAMVLDDLGNLWIGTEHKGVGILERNARTIKWFSSREWVSRPHSQGIHSIKLLDQNSLIIGSTGGIILVDIRTKTPKWFDTPKRSADVIDPIPISAIARVNNNEFLIGTEQGLFRGPLRGPFQYIKCSDPHLTWPNIDIVRSIDTSRGRAFIGTWGSGLRVFNLKTNKEIVVSTEQGLPSNVVYSAFAMKDSLVVMSTNAGLVVYDVARGMLNTQIKPQRGSQSLEFNSWSSLLTSSGTIFVGGVSGLNRIRIDEIHNPPAPTLYIKSIATLDGHLIESQQTVSGAITSIPYPMDGLQVKVGAIALASTQEVEYRFKINDQSSWITSSSGDFQFSELEPGSYSIVVEARYLLGVWSNQRLIAFRVLPPFWQTWWFISASTVVALAAIWLLASANARRRLQRRYEAERAIDDERIRIARDLHDDVGAGLAKIVVVSDNALASSPDNESLRTIQNTAREVIDSVRSIVWVIKSNDDRLSTTLGYIRDKLTDLLDESGVSFRYVEDLHSDPSVDIMLRRNIVLVLKEIFTNVVRHSGAMAVQMNVRTDEKSIVMVVSDDGSGFNTNAYPKGSGLENIRERVKQLSGKVKIESFPSKGTRVTIDVPLRSSSHQST